MEPRASARGWFDDRVFRSEAAGFSRRLHGHGRTDGEFALTEERDYTLPLIAGRDGELLLKVRAVPGARSDRILGVHGDALRVAIHAPPERGKANAALVERLARWLGVHRSAVALHAGEASRDKWVRIALGREELARRLREALETGR